MEAWDPCGCDGHLEQDVEDRVSGFHNGDPTEDERSATDPEFEAWLRAREADLEEQRLALLDQCDEEWAR